MVHRKQLKHFHEPGHLHEFTFSCYQNRPLLVDEVVLTAFSRAIDQANAELNILLVAFVYMPDHVHLLTYPLDPKPDIGLYLARLKQPLAKSAKVHFQQTDRSLVDELTIRERPGKYCFRFWQEGAGYDRNLICDPTIGSSINYIHANPVRRQYCERPLEWQWSSARYYGLEPPRQQFSELPFVHGIPGQAVTR